MLDWEVMRGGERGKILRGECQGEGGVISGCLIGKSGGREGGREK